jgi:hypothetical protein
VPIVSVLMPFMHLDFVRATGVVVAAAGALSSAPSLLRRGLTDLRLSIPAGLVASVGACAGARAGLTLPTDLLQLWLGVVILLTAALIALVRPRETAVDAQGDWLALRLGIGGAYREAGGGELRRWRPRAMVPGLILFAGIGFLAGLFGLGAGWANVPVLNLVMGVPLRLAVATSVFVLAVASPAAALVYASRGALLPLVAVPSVLGIMLGAKLGAWLLVRIRVGLLRGIVIGVLLAAGLAALLRGLDL